MIDESKRESPDAPLERGAMAFDTAVVTLEGVLPPGFSGPVAQQAQDLFRPLEVVLGPGEYTILLGGTRYRAGCRTRALSIVATSALCVGGFVAVWLENSSQEPRPFCVRLRGHCSRRHPGGGAPVSDEEVGCSSVWLGMIAGEQRADSREQTADSTQQTAPDPDPELKPEARSPKPSSSEDSP